MSNADKAVYYGDNGGDHDDYREKHADEMAEVFSLFCLDGIVGDPYQFGDQLFIYELRKRVQQVSQDQTYYQRPEASVRMPSPLRIVSVTRSMFLMTA